MYARSEPERYKLDLATVIVLLAVVQFVMLGAVISPGWVIGSTGWMKRNF